MFQKFFYMRFWNRSGTTLNSIEHHTKWFKCVCKLFLQWETNFFMWSYLACELRPEVSSLHCCPIPIYWFKCYDNLKNILVVSSQNRCCLSIGPWHWFLLLLNIFNWHFKKKNYTEIFYSANTIETFQTDILCFLDVLSWRNVWYLFGVVLTL